MKLQLVTYPWTWIEVPDDAVETAFHLLQDFVGDIPHSTYIDIIRLVHDELGGVGLARTKSVVDFAMNQLGLTHGKLVYSSLG